MSKRKPKVYSRVAFVVQETARCVGEVLRDLPFSKARGIAAMKAVEHDRVE